METPSRKHIIHWILILAFTYVCLALKSNVAWLVEYPAAIVFPVADILNDAMGWFVDIFSPFFRALSWILEWPIVWARYILQLLPWSVIVFLCCVLAYAAAGWRLVVLTFASLIYMVVVGYWFESMNSLALVAISVPLAIIVGFAFGVWGYFSKRAEQVIMPMLDLLQTVPAFAYLIPILMLFGFGTTVGLIASLLYAFPPMVRNTIVGLREIPSDIIESGLMAGATRAQLFWQVQVPTALKQILLGVNQATMAALSMVIIASIIGGTEDIGWEVLSMIRKARFGESLVAGIVIAFMAIVMDRITAGFALRENNDDILHMSFAQRHRYMLFALVGSTILILLSFLIPMLNDYPKTWEFTPAAALNDGLTYTIVHFRGFIQTFKNLTYFFLMLPVKIGLLNSVSPFSWGFELLTVHIVGYAVLCTGLTIWAALKQHETLAVAIAFVATLFFFGLINIPWPAIILIVTVGAWKLGGKGLAIGTFMAVGFLLIVGVWAQTMLSVYLCGIAVLISFLMGTTLGIWAAHNERVSKFLRPINDTMQTMPLFVILIPFVMIFQIGEFTALLAIMAYAFVPAIRYAEHGLRTLPETVIEAGQCMGCTPSQLLWQIKIPLALPVMMLGLNQTIMYGIAMLVIAALVGTNGLGQLVYIALSKADFGIGMTAGVGMAIIAMIADRMTQAWSKKRQEELGL